MKSNRRKFIRNLGAGATGLTFGPQAIALASGTSSPAKDEDRQILFIGDNIAVAETTNGKVRGFIHKDIFNFLGIPYGANTSGNNRFMLPQKPDHLNDIFPAAYWPNAVPQLLDNFYTNRYLAFTDYYLYVKQNRNKLDINTL